MPTPLRQIAAVFGVQFDDRQLQQGTRTINGAVGLLRQFGQTLVGNDLVQGIRSFVEGFEQQASALQDASDRLGVTTRELQELHHAARMSGMSAEQMDGALARLSDSLGAVAGHADRGTQQLHALGIATRDATGQARPAQDVMGDLADAMDGIEDPARRVAISVDIFGRAAGTRLAPLLNNGTNGLAAMRREFQALGGGLDDVSVRAGAEFGDAMDRWNVATDSLRARLAVELLPVLTRVVGWVSHAAAALSNLVRGTHVVQVALVALGAVAAVAGVAMLAAWAPVIAPIALVAAGIAAVVLIVDDLITFIEGGDSAIGRFIDSMFGLGTARAFVEDLRHFWAELGRDIRDVTQDVERFLARFENVRNFIGDAALGPLRPAMALARRISGTPEPSTAQDAQNEQYAQMGRDALADVERQMRAPQTVTAAATAAAPVVHHTTRTQHNEFHIKGPSPLEIARQVDQRLEARERTQADADDPRAGRE